MNNTASNLLPVLALRRNPTKVSSPVGLPVAGDGPRLLDHVAVTYGRYLVLPPGAADALALVVAHFHAYDAFLHTPRLSFQAAEMGCGKSTALAIIACLVPFPLIVENMSTAVLFRATSLGRFTLLLDEADTWLLTNDEMRGVLNSGHRRGGQVLRCNKNGVVRYNVFAPVVLAGIGALPGTLQDRSIVVRLTRAKPGEVPARFDSRWTAPEDQLRSRLAEWASYNFDSLKDCDPVMPSEALNRIADNWRPLFAVAEIAGGDWPHRALEAFHQLNQHRVEDQSIRIKLLRDLRVIFGATRATKLPSAQIVSELAKIEGQPWAEYQGRRPISTHQLAFLLRGFGIVPRTVRFGTNTAKGYDLEDFKDVFDRFLPQTVTP
jgi:hypothetical protein